MFVATNERERLRYISENERGRIVRWLPWYRLSSRIDSVAARQTVDVLIYFVCNKSRGNQYESGKEYIHFENEPDTICDCTRAAFKITDFGKFCGYFFSLFFFFFSFLFFWYAELFSLFVWYMKRKVYISNLMKTSLLKLSTFFFIKSKLDDTDSVFLFFDSFWWPLIGLNILE